MPPPAPVVVNVPVGAPAAGYKASLAPQFDFVINDYGPSVAVDLREGSGIITEYFRATRLCGEGDTLTEATWEPLREHQPHEHNAERCQELLQWADKHLAEDPTSMWRQLRVLRARTFGLGKHLPRFLAQEVPRIFARMPGASLWFISVDELLARRLSFLRGQLALTLTPDLPLGTPDFDGFRLLSAHSLTGGGADFAGALSLPLLAFSPGVIGIPLSWAPHALVLLFGQTVDLHKPESDSPSNVFRPRAFGRPEGWSDPPFWRDLTPAEVEPLIPWWIERLNILYSHAADPTRFHDSFGRHDAGAQAAWHLTLERMLVDATLMLSEPTAADIVRMQLAFDILDKAEGLLGYTESGPGFKDLLRRSKTLPRIVRAWTTLPDPLERRFRDHSRVTFDSLYEDIRGHALKHRLTKNGVLVGDGDPSSPRPVSIDEYATRLLREIRNSAHGLGRLLRENERNLIATHTGDVPRQLADLTGLIVLALLADADRLCQGRWW